MGIASHLAGKEVAVGVAGWARTRWKHSLSAGRGSWDHTGITGSPLPSRTPFQTKPALTAENLALRQQLAVLERSVRRPKRSQQEGILWA